MKAPRSVYKQLMTKEVIKNLPPLYSTEEIPTENKTVVLKFFNPCGAQTWYVTEGEQIEDQEVENTGGLPDYMFFSYADGFPFPEWGYVTLAQLVGLELPFGLNIERDIHFQPCSFKDI